MFTVFLKFSEIKLFLNKLFCFLSIACVRLTTLTNEFKR
jgi:hypothetical protein